MCLSLPAHFSYQLLVPTIYSFSHTNSTHLFIHFPHFHCLSQSLEPNARHWAGAELFSNIYQHHCMLCSSAIAIEWLLLLSGPSSSNHCCSKSMPRTADVHLGGFHLGEDIASDSAFSLAGWCVDAFAVLRYLRWAVLLHGSGKQTTQQFAIRVRRGNIMWVQCQSARSRPRVVQEWMLAELLAWFLNDKN